MHYKSEKKVQTEILDWIKSIKGYSIKTIVSNRKGIPDIICCFEGRFVAIEVKAENKDFRDVSKLQRLELGKINDSGGLGFYANSLDYVKIIFDEYLMEL